jgi:metal-sulfur cluster biosynthetic enzyme
MVTAERVREILKNVHDPELGYNIVDLGLVYDIAADEQGNVNILITLTSPGCPLGDVIEKDIRDKVKLLEGVGTITVKITFSPPWGPAKASEDLKREFALMGIPVGE